MKTPPPLLRRLPLSRLPLAMTLAVGAVFATGCGSSGTTPPKFSGNTSVVVLASSTANDQLFQFSVTLQGLTLTSQSGQTVSLLATPAGDEFMHLNGHVEPLATVSVPQGIYISAAATVSGAFPACAGQSPGTLLVDEALGGLNGLTPASIELEQPITVTGSAMGLVLNLQVSKTAPFNGGCSSSLTNAVTITPTFSLTPISIAAQPTNSANGKVLGVEGLISSVDADGNGFSAGALYSMNESGNLPTWQVSVSSGTVFQGVGSTSGLAVGMPIDMDLVIEPDGSLLGARVAVYDTDTTNLSLAFGPPIAIYSSGDYQADYPVTDTVEIEQYGQLSELTGLYSLSGATTQISGQLANLQSLPFPATFDTANMVDGQNILFSTHAPIEPFQALTTITLLPQTLDGTVSAISSEGNFTTYTVTLAPYDLFPNLAVQPGQTTLLTNPNTVVVYADSNTQMLNSSAVSVGGLFRFYGLVFNDNGTLRMDSAQVNDGVAE
ncbi:MAG: hypothetical protein WAK89_11700 [Candidatus Sulfotelmatobacter sp.]